MTEKAEPRLPQRFENPARCGTCFAPWIFDTDHLGRVHHRHPPKKCEPPAYAEAIEEPRGACSECGNDIPQRRVTAGKPPKTCGPTCAKARNLRINREKTERERRRVKRLWMAAA